MRPSQCGYDIVNIVWNDDHRDDYTETILANFNVVCIGIYSLDSGADSCENQAHLGPLQNGMVLPLIVLAALVRETAVYAHIQVRALQTVNCDRSGNGRVRYSSNTSL